VLCMCKCLRKTNYPDSLQCALAPSPVCILTTRQAAVVLASGHKFLKWLCVHHYSHRNTYEFSGDSF
jgi:hypothetical protein